MMESEKKFYKKSQLKRTYWKKRINADEVINTLNQLIQEKIKHILTIKKEGISVVEYSLDKSDILRIKEEIKKLDGVKRDMEVLAGYYNIWLRK